MTWLLILFPSLVLACCLAVITGTELAHRKVRRLRKARRAHG